MTLPKPLLGDASACWLEAGELKALFLPGRGMLGASFLHRGQELLGRVEDLEAAAAKGSTAGIPFLYPWANRLKGTRYRCAGREVSLDKDSPLIHLDEHGQPIHGVPWARLCWEVTRQTKDTVRARLDWTTAELLAVFPYRHHVELAVALRPEGLTLTTCVLSDAGDQVPVSFGFHPYFALGSEGRASARLVLPRMRRFVLDAHGLPTGEETAYGGFDGLLGETAFDDGFALEGASAALSISSARRRLTVEFLAGYGCAQVFAPKGKALVALEPMTAPTAALSECRGLSVLEPDTKYLATFRILVDADGVGLS